MSDSIDTTTEITANSALPPSADLKAGDDGPITDWDEINEPVAAKASNESAKAGIAESEPSALLSAQVITKQNPPATPKYNRDKLPTTKNATALPGAFFFLTLKYKTNLIHQVVAYDPYVVPNNMAADIAAYYEANELPYYEYFDESATGKWEFNKNYYAGTFGGKNNPNKGVRSPAWPFAGNDTAIETGVNIAYWNNGNESGIFTSAPGTPFNRTTALTPVVGLFPASGKNFIKEGSKAFKILNAAQVDFYAMAAGKLGS